MRKRWRIIFICVIVALLAVGSDSSDDTSQAASMPEFVFSYPSNWRITRQEAEFDHQLKVIQNERGIEINYYSLEGGFTSRNYGGNKILNSVHITKVCDSNLSLADYNGKSYSSLGKFVVAKIKVYAYDDGMTEDGQIEFDGPAYYAIVPESYLGDKVFCGMGYWDLCSFDYVKPMLVLADSPDGKYSKEEEKQVIQILASFRLS